MPEIKELIHLLRSVSNSANQMAKRANAGVPVDVHELHRLNEVIQQLWDMMNGILIRLSDAH